MFCRNNSYCKYESIHQGEMKQSAVSSVFRKLVGAFQNYFMLFMSDNQACARLKFLSPCLTLYCKYVAATLDKDRQDRQAAAAVT